MTTYIIGQTAVINGVFKDPKTQVGLIVADLELRILPPAPAAEIIVSSGFANPSQGVYTYNQLLTTPGLWQYRWDSDGPYDVVSEGKLLVIQNSFSYPP